MNSEAGHLNINVRPSRHNDEPRHQDFPDHDAYLLAWYTWRALRRDDRLTDDERATQFTVIEAHMRSRSV